MSSIKKYFLDILLISMPFSLSAQPEPETVTPIESAEASSQARQSLIRIFQQNDLVIRVANLDTVQLVGEFDHPLDKPAPSLTGSSENIFRVRMNPDPHCDPVYLFRLSRESASAEILRLADHTLQLYTNADGVPVWRLRLTFRGSDVVYPLRLSSGALRLQTGLPLTIAVGGWVSIEYHIELFGPLDVKDSALGGKAYMRRSLFKYRTSELLETPVEVQGTLSVSKSVSGVASFVTPQFRRGMMDAVRRLVVLVEEAPDAIIASELRVLSETIVSEFYNRRRGPSNLKITSRALFADFIKDSMGRENLDMKIFEAKVDALWRSFNQERQLFRGDLLFSFFLRECLKQARRGR